MANRFYLKFILVFILTTIWISPSVVFAQDIYGFASYWEIEEADGTWGGGVGVALPLFTEYLRLDGRVYIFENSDLDDDDELEVVPLDFGGQFHFLPDETLDPYILGGASYVYVDSDRIDVDSDFGAYLGVGLDFSLGEHLTIFGEGLYRFFEPDAEIGSRSDSLDLNGVTANAGLKFNF